jgi:hypothetical protein
VKFWDLLKGSRFLADAGQHLGKNESNIHSTALNSMNPENACFFLSDIPGQ